MPTPPTYQPGAEPEVQIAFIAASLQAACEKLADESPPQSSEDDSSPVKGEREDNGADNPASAEASADKGEEKSEKRKPRDAANKWTPKDPKDWLYDKKGRPAGILKRAFLDRTDLGMAQRLTHYAGGRIRFCDRLGWLAWDGHRFDLEGGEALARIEVTKMIDKIKYEEFPAFVAHGMTEAEQRLKYGPTFGDKGAMKDVDTRIKAGGKAPPGCSASEANKKFRDRTNGLIAAGVKLGDSAKQKSVLDTAATLPAFRVEFDQLDSAKFEVATPAGVLVLPGFLTEEEKAALKAAPAQLTAEMEPEVDKTRDQVSAQIYLDSFAAVKMRKSSPDDESFPTRVTAAKPDLGALREDADLAPLWRAHLAKVLPAKSVRQSFQRIMGSLLADHNPRNRMIMMRGPGGDGKSVTIRAIQNVLGDYFRKGNVKSLMYDPRASASGPREDLMRLAGGTRAAVFSEPHKNDELGVDIVKDITGGEELSARGGYSKQIEFFPQFKPILICNPRPKIKGDDDGIWRRIIEMPFVNKIPASEVDTRIIAKLEAERDGILHWMIEGYLDWRARDFSYDLAEEIIEVTEDYRRTASAVHAWMADRIIWKKWWNWSAINEAAPELERLIKEGDAAAIEQAMATPGFMASDPEVFAPPEFSPREDIYADFTAWCHDNGQDEWKPNSFSYEFSDKAKAAGGRSARHGVKGRFWFNFDFIDGQPRRVADAAEDAAYKAGAM